MPRLNSRAQALCGVAGVPGSLDGRPLPVLIPEWLSDDAIIGMTGSDAAGWKLVRVDPHDGEVTDVAPSGASAIVAGGGRYQAVLYTEPQTTWFGSLGSQAGPDIYAAGPDGTIAWKRDRQADSGIVFTAPDGTEIPVDDAVPILPGVVQVTGRLEGIWLDRQGIRTLNRPVPRTALPPTSRLRVARANIGEEWIVYDHDGVGLIAQVYGESVGYILESRPICYGFEAVPSPDVPDEIVIAWSVTEGEAPGDLVDVAVSRRGVRFLVDPDGAARHVPQLQRLIVAEPEPAPTYAIQAHPRKLWIAPFYSFGRYGDSPVEDFRRYGNAALLVGDERDPAVFGQEVARVYPLGLPLICAGDVGPDHIGNVVAWWVAGKDATAVGRAVQEALARAEKPVIAYLDGGSVDAWPVTRPSWVTDRVWPAVQAYRIPGEPIASMRARLEAIFTHLASWNVYTVLTPRFDDVNGTQPVTFTVEAMPLYADLIQRFPICGVMPFADRRGTGIAKVPELRAWAQAFALANVTRPNRFDYWRPSASSMGAVLKNKLSQTTELVTLSADEKQFLLGRLS